MDQQALKALDTWFFTPQGIAASHAFAQQLKEIFSDLQLQLVGKNLLQVGACGQNEWLRQLNFQQKWIYSLSSPHSAYHAIHVCGSPQKLPFAAESLDCVVIPLSLEVMNWNDHPIDELDRILKPMGHCIFWGINSWSLWGMAMRMGWLNCYNSEKGHPISLFRLKHALMHRGYQVLYLSPFYYIPPVKHPKLIEQFEILNEVGKMVSPCPGGFYCMIVQKHMPNWIKPKHSAVGWRYVILEPNFQPG